MIQLDCRRRSSGVPILSREEIEFFAEDLLRDFRPEYLKEPQEIDIDLFVQEYMGMDQDFQFLSNNGCYLGMTVFNDTDRLPVYDPVRRRAEYAHVDANTIIIDSRLLEEEQKAKYMFTMGHEAFHGMMHGAYFALLPGQISWFDTFGPEFSEPMIKCRKMAPGGRNRKNYRDWTDYDWMEWQANAGSSAILMPRPAVMLINEELEAKGYRGMDKARTFVKEIMNVFNVSYSAATYRLEGLKLLDNILEVREGVIRYKNI